MSTNLESEARTTLTRTTIHRAGTSVGRAPEGIATGPFWIEMLVESNRDGENTVMHAVVEPGVITHWHTHPRGQVLYVLSGVGLVQCDGGPVEEVRAGDCVCFAPGELHWHGATPNSTFSYVSIQAVEDGKVVTWMEPVTLAGRAR
jgi:quercetin dioxygenase-like cupin family protein